MDDFMIKRMVANILRNRKEIFNYLGYFWPEDIEAGILAIPQDLVNTTLKKDLIKRIGQNIKDYTVSFQDGAAFLDADIEYDFIGAFKVKYCFEVQLLYFEGNKRQAVINYTEQVDSNGSFLRTMALKTITMNATLLQKALEQLKGSGVEVTNNSVIIDFYKMRLMDKVPPTTTINFLDCEDGTLRLSFKI